MIIDKSHRPWMIFSVIALVSATALFAVYVRLSQQGPSGGSWQGLLFGIVGSVLMTVAGALSARKKLPRARLGAAQTWLRAHIWLGLLSVPCILFHAGFRWGGLLEQALWLTFAMVIISGLMGLVFQHYLPGVLKASTPKEAMFEQITAVCEALRRTADERVAAICGTLFEPPPEVAPLGSAVTTDVGIQTLRQFYVTTVRPYLAADWRGAVPLQDVSRCGAIFSQVRQSLPQRLHGVLAELDAICDERRQLAWQVRLHRWLHLWLFLHVPLSLTLLVLGLAHAIAAAYY